MAGDGAPWNGKGPVDRRGLEGFARLRTVYRARTFADPPVVVGFGVVVVATNVIGGTIYHCGTECSTADRLRRRRLTRHLAFGLPRSHFSSRGQATSFQRFQ